ncbi:MAG: RecQ family ATP-dependent DNA helicase [Bacteroidales bacterium]|nr:RecQ family ATP-dependent DNA helicase [Bacteroidales bacterium]
MTPSEALERYWGHTSFRPMQEEIISEALAGHDVLAILPTGGGKSVCFQVPALLRDGIALVVTPLVALMKDQVQNLRERGIKALALHAGLSRREADGVLNHAAYGDAKFLYVSPERLANPRFRAWLGELPVNFLVVDEAHCISAWGYDFRPEYLRIGELRPQLDVPVIALTATATPKVAEDICARLAAGGRTFRTLRSGFERPNLTYVVRKCEDKRGQLLDICNGVPGSGIVYLRQRRKCEEMAAFLQANGVDADFYHAGLDGTERARRQEAWKAGQLRIMVCTNAFGMGIDKADVRFVTHFEPCESLEAYFQESGRAGRDGARAYAVQLWNDADLVRLRQLPALSYPPLDRIEEIYQQLHVFHNLPYETGEGCCLSFDLEAFSRHFHRKRTDVHYALHYLQQAGHLTFCEDIDTDTRIQITADRQALYDITLPEPQMLAVLDILMRDCPGIFSGAVGISEQGTARQAGISVPALRQLLYRMSLLHIIRYIPAAHNDLVVLHHIRLRPGNLDLQAARYAFLQDQCAARVQAVEAYLTDNGECRPRQLLRYFGQESPAPCGQCDVCRAHPEARKSTEARLRELIRQGMDETAILQLCRRPDSGLGADAVETYRRLLDEEI